MASTHDVQVICQPLTPRLHLYDMFDTDWEHMEAMAKVLSALKFGAQELKRFYESARQSLVIGVKSAKRPRADATLDQSRPLERNPSLSLPYPLRPALEHQVGGRDAGTQPERLQLQRTLLYRCQRPGDVQHRLVKFVQHGSYGEGVQRAWAQQGLAPEVYVVTPLPGGLRMVEMEELQGEDGWASVAVLPVSERSEQLFEAVKAALQQAHQVEVSPGKFGVHGDARASNVLVCLPSEQRQPLPSQSEVDVVQHQHPPATCIKVRFVDFDWAGLADEAELPARAVPWNGLPSNRKLTRDYDLAVWEQTKLRDNTTGVLRGASADDDE